MCGVAGVFTYHRPLLESDRQSLSQISDEMRQRGPDGAGIWACERQRVAFAHRRLAIIDLTDNASQPMVDPAAGNVLVFNGEIYNYRELRTELEAHGYQFHSESDTEVLLLAWHRFGTDVFRRLRGMYAFALWDGASQTLTLARDFFGIKPLYYRNDGRSICFASQVKAILAGLDQLPAAEPAGHVGFYLWGHVPEPFTMYRGIRAVPAGHFIQIKRDGVCTVRSHTNVSDVFTIANDETTASITSSDALAEFDRQLEQSVRCHHVADVPVGVFLSSGIDSTMLATVTRRIGHKLKTVTLGFDEFRGTGQDEVPLAERVAECLGAEHHTVRITKQQFHDALDDILRRMDQPTIDGVNTYLVSRAAAQIGIKVVLSGLGGDELLGGYPSFRQIPRVVRFVRNIPCRRTVGRAIRQITAPVLNRLTSPKYAGIVELGGSFGGAYLLRRGLYMPWELSKVLDPDFARTGWEDLQPLARVDESISPICKSATRVSALESQWYMRNQLLRDTDWASMAHSVEVRVPFVDVPFATAVATLRQRCPGLTKQNAFQRVTPSLPAELKNRPKSGFTIPVERWALDQHPAYAGQRSYRGWAQFVYQSWQHQ